MMPFPWESIREALRRREAILKRTISSVSDWQTRDRDLKAVEQEMLKVFSMWWEQIRKENHGV